MRLFGKSLQTYTDEELFTRIREGDSKAFGELYDRYASWLMRYFYRMLWKNRELAEDQVQEFFTKLAANVDVYDGKRSFKTWAFSVANNMCKNHYRHAAVKEKSAPMISAELNETEFSRSSEEMDHSTFMERLEDELLLLDDERRSTFVLRFFDELSIKEIALALDCSEGTVKSRIFYTLQHLNKKLKDFEHLLLNERL